MLERWSVAAVHGWTLVQPGIALVKSDANPARMRTAHRPWLTCSRRRATTPCPSTTVDNAECTTTAVARTVLYRCLFFPSQGTILFRRRRNDFHYEFMSIDSNFESIFVYKTVFRSDFRAEIRRIPFLVRVAGETGGDGDIFSRAGRLTVRGYMWYKAATHVFPHNFPTTTLYRRH